MSESHAKLNSDIEFWLEQSRGETEILTLRVNRRTPVITIDKWELQDARTHNVNHITVSKRDNGHVIVQGHPLVIEFRNLFCRPHGGWWMNTRNQVVGDRSEPTEEPKKPYSLRISQLLMLTERVDRSLKRQSPCGPRTC